MAFAAYGTPWRGRPRPGLPHTANGGGHQPAGRNDQLEETAERASPPPSSNATSARPRSALRSSAEVVAALAIGAPTQRLAHCVVVATEKASPRMGHRPGIRDGAGAH